MTCRFSTKEVQVLDTIFKDEAIMKHPFKPKKYDGYLDDLARDIADLRYDKILLFLRFLSECIIKDGIKDGKAGKKKLAKLLSDCGEDIAISADRMSEIWDLCEPYMPKVNCKTHVECPHGGCVQTHQEAGTYEGWFPVCKECDECTELDPYDGEDV